ncbi:MAG: type IX secretion system membrane protein PorP/SprF [Flavobacteriaceae bacterium]|nr:type IX secretion system membrane protein PorP/SprF [Flavobacteriaceae bacterium]
MKKFLLLLSLSFLLFTTKSYGQQDPQYTQYMYNMNVINPAYAGSKGNLTFTSLYRQQWSGVEGAPETITISGHTPVSEKVGLGLSVIADEVGPVRETNVYGDFAYTLNLGGTARLALGIKAGLTFHDIGLNNLIINDPGDPFFSENVSETTFNVGTGAFFYTDRFYLGLSMPNLLEQTHLDTNDLEIGSETQHYFFTGGYVFDLNPTIKFKPHFMVKGAFDAPISFDLNTNFLFYERLELGASYRLEDSFSGLIGFYITESIRFGYAYDRVVSDLDVVTSSSHEVFLTFDLNFPRRPSVSPRFF